MKTNEIAALMVTELEKANKKFPKFNSRHEGYAIIKEEVDELWDEIKKKHPDKQRMLEEVIQVGAMTMKFVQLLVGVKEEENEKDEAEKLSELDRKCRQCRYYVMADENIKELGHDPCGTCNELSNWKPKEE